MNVMEIVSNTGMNGAIKHCLTLTRELRQRGNRLTLVCHGDAWIAEQAAAEGVDVVASDLHRWPTDELRRIAAIVREKKIDVIHTHMSRAHFFGVLLRWLCKVPCVATAHNRLFQPHWMFNDHVIAVSEATRRYHQSYNLVRSSRIETIFNFIDHRRARRISADARARVRDTLGIDDSTPLVGTIGIVRAKKGQIHLVRAMPQVLAECPRARLLIVGSEIDDAYVSQVKAVADRLGVGANITWSGHRDDAAEIMSALDLCVSSSLEENLSTVILEAMAAALPVVATSVGGNPECVVPGTTGTLVPPGDSNALGRAIVDMLSDPERCRRFGEAGRERVRNHFSTERVIPRIEATLERVAQRRRAA